MSFMRTVTIGLTGAAGIYGGLVLYRYVCFFHHRTIIMFVFLQESISSKHNTRAMSNYSVRQRLLQERILGLERK